MRREGRGRGNHGLARARLVGVRIFGAALVGRAVLTVLMAGAIAMHVEIGDPALEAVPAPTFFLVSVHVT